MQPTPHSHLYLLLSILVVSLQTAYVCFMGYSLWFLIFSGTCTLFACIFSFHQTQLYFIPFLQSVSTTILSSIVCILSYTNSGFLFPYSNAWIAVSVMNFALPWLALLAHHFWDYNEDRDGFLRVFTAQSAIFLTAYIIFLILCSANRWLLSPYHKIIAGSNRFIPFYTTSLYMEDSIFSGASLVPVMQFMILFTLCFVPIGFFLRFFIRNMLPVARKLFFINAFIIISLAVVLLTKEGFLMDHEILIALGLFLGYFLYLMFNSLFRYFSGGYDFLSSNRQERSFFH